MITPQQASLEILKRSKPLPARVLPLEQAWGRLLLAPVRAPYAYPLFDNAALDGYAIRAGDTLKAARSKPAVLKLVGSQFAGRARKGHLKKGQALHVTTGAPLPPGADALVPYEAVRVSGARVVLETPARRGQNVRRKGEDGAKGCVLARSGDRLHARRLALLASFGVETVTVAPAPRVAVAVSGDELIGAGQRPKPGKIFNGNGPALRALLRESGTEAVGEAWLPDKAGVQARRIAALLNDCDVLLVSGGMSVGKRDLAKPVLEGLGVRRVFWNVAQKPGKPLYFGVRGRQLVFGLPGNPAALIACFAVYVAPCLRALAGEGPLPRARAALAHAVEATAGKALFLKARTRGEGRSSRVALLKGQGSHLLRSLADGNALVLRRARAGALAKGRRVDVLPL